jgi:hypothetical protein
MKNKEFKFDCVIAMGDIIDREWRFYSTDDKFLIVVRPQSKDSVYNESVHGLLRDVKKLTDHKKFEMQLSLIEIDEASIHNDELVYIYKIDNSDNMYTYKFKSLYDNKEMEFAIISTEEVKDFILKDQLYNLYFEKFIRVIDHL